MNNLVAFYYGIVFHPDGDPLDDILAKDDKWYEDTGSRLLEKSPLDRIKVNRIRIICLMGWRLDNVKNYFA